MYRIKGFTLNVKLYLFNSLNISFYWFHTENICDKKLFYERICSFFQIQLNFFMMNAFCMQGNVNDFKFYSSLNGSSVYNANVD